MAPGEKITLSDSANAALAQIAVHLEYLAEGQHSQQISITAIAQAQERQAAAIESLTKHGCTLGEKHGRWQAEHDQKHGEIIIQKAGAAKPAAWASGISLVVIAVLEWLRQTFGAAAKP